MTAVGTLNRDQVGAVLAAAITAPSLHNSQPWRFRCTPTAIELHADEGHTLPAADPDGRELRLACGAALMNLRLAITGLGIHPVIRLLPDPHRPTLLATVRPQGRRPVTPEELTLLAAIPRRRTNRRPFTSVPVPPRVINSLRRAAKTEQAWLARLGPAQLPLLRSMVAQAHTIQQRDSAFRAEWAAWTGRGEREPVGVPARSSGPAPEPQDEWVLRDFSGGTARTRVPGKDFEPNPLIVAVGSFHDLPLAQLHAGQAMQRVLLTATADGLSASFISQVVEVPGVRRQLRGLVGGGLWPQVVLRLGYGSLMPPTPRRPLTEVVDDGVLGLA
ncbi:MAG TPA: nitroreductase [Pseudonocardiaceae bacterium]|jgi:nitroreductase|nr:nitroreductase [Pseudonocardiaceae bacterium]